MAKEFFGTAHHEFPVAGRCHDCKTPSRTYRCPECKAAFMTKHLRFGGSIGPGLLEADDEYHVEHRFVKATFAHRMMVKC